MPKKNYFQFKKRKAERHENRPIKPRSLAEDENLTGFVRGIPADSEDEERFSRSFDKTNRKYEYQVEIPVATSLPGQGKKVDFIVNYSQPFEPRGFISHYYSIAQEGGDILREMFLNDAFSRIGYLPLKTAKYDEYDGGQEAVDAYVRNNL